MVVKVVCADVDDGLQEQGVSDGVHPECVGASGGVVVEELGWGTGVGWVQWIHDAGEVDGHVHAVQQIPAARDLAREFLPAEPCGVVELHLDLTHRKVGCACVCGLPEGDLGGGDQIDILRSLDCLFFETSGQSASESECEYVPLVPDTLMPYMISGE